MAALALALLAVVAGVLSVTTPCCLPMIPSYLSYVSSSGGAEGPQDRAGAVRAAAYFVAGFGAVFTALGASLGLIGPVVVRVLPQAERVAGVVVIVIGLHLAGIVRLPARSTGAAPRFAAAGSRLDGVLLGMAFAIGFVPTLGPVLGTVLTLASGEATVAWGAVLLALYSLGFGIPYVLMALGLQRATASVAWLQRNVRRLQLAGGLLLVGVGALFVSGVWRTFFTPIAGWLARFGWPPI